MEKHLFRVTKCVLFRSHKQNNNHYDKTKIYMGSRYFLLFCIQIEITRKEIPNLPLYLTYRKTLVFNYMTELINIKIWFCVYCSRYCYKIWGSFFLPLSFFQMKNDPLLLCLMEKTTMKCDRSIISFRHKVILYSVLLIAIETFLKWSFCPNGITSKERLNTLEIPMEKSLKWDRNNVLLNRNNRKPLSSALILEPYTSTLKIPFIDDRDTSLLLATSYILNRSKSCVVKYITLSALWALRIPTW